MRVSPRRVGPPGTPSHRNDIGAAPVDRPTAAVIGDLGYLPPPVPPPQRRGESQERHERGRDPESRTAARRLGRRRRGRLRDRGGRCRRRPGRRPGRRPRRRGRRVGSARSTISTALAAVVSPSVWLPHASDTDGDGRRPDAVLHPRPHGRDDDVPRAAGREFDRDRHIARVAVGRAPGEPGTAPTVLAVTTGNGDQRREPAAPESVDVDPRRCCRRRPRPSRPGSRRARRRTRPVPPTLPAPSADGTTRSVTAATAYPFITVRVYH